MMGNSKPLASLSSGLLARKGQARPAMRPQGFAGFGSVNEQMDDLGWNDMGLTEGPAPVTPITPAVADMVPDQAPVPPVLTERAALADEWSGPDEAEAEIDAGDDAEPAPILDQIRKPKRRATPKPPRARTGDAPAKAAFTLRLDSDRHLRLRLACALKRRSAQQIVTEALDRYLATDKELDDVVGRVAGHG